MTVFNLAIELAYWQQTVIRSVLALVAALDSWLMACSIPTKILVT